MAEAMRSSLEACQLTGIIRDPPALFIAEDRCLVKRQRIGFDNTLGGQCSVSLLVIFLATLVHLSILILCLCPLRGRPLTIPPRGQNFSCTETQNTLSRAALFFPGTEHLQILLGA